MHRTLISAALSVLAWLPALGGDLLSIAPFEVAAGETVTVTLDLDDESGVYSAFLLDLYLPEGVEIAWDADYEEYMVYATSRALERSHTCDVVLRHDASGRPFYRMLAESPTLKPLGGGALYELTLTATDLVGTGDQQASLRDVSVSDTEGRGVTFDKIALSVRTRVDVSVGASGYATLSWPRPLDFTGSGAAAYVVTSVGGGSVSLSPVDIVGAGVGVVVRADTGVYNPRVAADDESAPTASLLTGTLREPFTVTGGGVFVLSDLRDGQAGFYRAAEGLAVPPYRAYLQAPAEAAEMLSFSTVVTSAGGVPQSLTDTDGRPSDNSAAVYDLSGRRVDVAAGRRPAPGLYVSGGRKVVIR